MKTYTVNISMACKVVVPEQFTAEFIGMANGPAEDCTPFIRQAYDSNIIDGVLNQCAFTAAILKNGLRKYMRDSLVQELDSSGVGGTVAPAVVTVQAIDVPVYDELGFNCGTAEEVLADCPNAKEPE